MRTVKGMVKKAAPSPAMNRLEERKGGGALMSFAVEEVKRGRANEKRND